MKNEKWDDVHGNTTPDDRMVAFLESPTDSYAILQLREDVDDNIPLPKVTDQITVSLLSFGHSRCCVPYSVPPAFLMEKS